MGYFGKDPSQPELSGKVSFAEGEDFVIHDDLSADDPEYDTYPLNAGSA